jgi:hypothetical protein
MSYRGLSPVSSICDVAGRRADEGALCDGSFDFHMETKNVAVTYDTREASSIGS